MYFCALENVFLYLFPYFYLLWIMISSLRRDQISIISWYFKKKLKWYLQKQDRANDYFFLQQQKSLSKIAHHLHYSLIIFKLLSRHFNGSMIKILNFFFMCAFFLNHRRNDFRVSCQSKSTGTCHLSWHCKDKMSNEFFMLILWNFLFPEYVNNTLQKWDICIWWNYSIKRFKFFHCFGIRKKLPIYNVFLYIFKKMTNPFKAFL